MHKNVFIGMGSNLGDRSATLDRAAAELANTPGIVNITTSSIIETEAIGGPEGQGPFLNAVARIETALSPRELLDRLHAIERSAGRVRGLRRGARTLDLDLLLYNDIILHEADLIVPHPRMCVRRFVLGPLAEIAGEMIEPTTRRTIAELLANLAARPRAVVVLDDEVARRDAIVQGVCADRAIEAEGWIVKGIDHHLIQTSDLNSFERVFPEIARPTFVVDMTREPIVASNRPIGVPRIVPECDDVESVVSEVLASCASCR